MKRFAFSNLNNEP